MTRTDDHEPILIGIKPENPPCVTTIDTIGVLHMYQKSQYFKKLRYSDPYLLAKSGLLEVQSLLQYLVSSLVHSCSQCIIAIIEVNSKKRTCTAKRGVSATFPRI